MPGPLPRLPAQPEARGLRPARRRAVRNEVVATLDTLERFHLPTEGLRSKSWNEFSRPDAPDLDFVFTVCGNAAREQCPHWPGQPMTAHWSVDDPAAVEGSQEDRSRAFQRAYRELDARIKLFTALPFEGLDRMALQQRLHDIGRTGKGTAQTAATFMAARDGEIKHP